ncbi:MAG TPA: DUF4032 domain-containing protein [Candidatus Dormibacteraeota bacterium]|jgi:hypothetical protein|nr:DUF4032 domain-containing protein [Candidatus Dormibacteraeota bacterium]
MRFLFSPPDEAAVGLLTLPWAEPLESWADDRIVEIRQRGISRHVVRFVVEGGCLYALKQMSENLARREHRLLRLLGELHIPAVGVRGVVVDRGPRLQPEADAVLVTTFLEYSTSYRTLFSNPRGGPQSHKLLDALIQLLVRLHLAGFFWGDCSLSNTLFRLDAGALEAYLVDTETSEHHESLSDGQRIYDVDLAREHVGGELMDLERGDLLPAGLDPVVLADSIPARYLALWDELTREEVLRPEEQRYRVANRLRRLNELGFDADEVELVSSGSGYRLRVQTRVAEPGDQRQRLFMRTGLDVQENQARRLLNDIAGFRGYLEQKSGRPVPESVAANRWLTEVYDPVVAAIPQQLRGRLAPAEIFHEILLHRWYLSESAGHDVGTTAAAESYYKSILPAVPEQFSSGDVASVSKLRGRAAPRPRRRET